MEKGALSLRDWIDYMRMDEIWLKANTEIHDRSDAWCENSLFAMGSVILFKISVEYVEMDWINERKNARRRAIAQMNSETN
jgi:hypothetical protein